MTTRRVTLAALVSVVLLATACYKPSKPAPTMRLGGDYGLVTKDQLRGEQVCWATGVSANRFHWTFTEDRWEIQRDSNPIPREVLDTLLGKGAEAQRIEGKWDLADRTLTLSEIQADKKGGYPDVQIKPFRTPVVRMYFGETQYVVTPKP